MCLLSRSLFVLLYFIILLIVFSVLVCIVSDYSLGTLKVKLIAKIFLLILQLYCIFFQILPRSDKHHRRLVFIKILLVKFIGQFIEYDWNILNYSVLVGKHQIRTEETIQTGRAYHTGNIGHKTHTNKQKRRGEKGAREG